MFLLWLRQLPCCRDWTPASVPPRAEGRFSPTNTPVFPPSSLYSFPLIQSSCLLSAGVLYALLCLKVYSCCIWRERCTPHPPTHLPSCSSTVTFQKTSAHVTTMLKTQNVILHFSQSKVLSKIYMTQTSWPHWLSGLLSTSLNSTHISWLAGP